MDILKLKAKSAARERGDWVDGITDFGDIGLKVRGTNSAAFRNYRDGTFRAVGKAERNADGEITLETQQRIVRDAMAEVGLIDWRNMTNGDEPLSFDKKFARELLDDQIFYDGVLEAMIKVDTMALPAPKPATDGTVAVKDAAPEDGLGNSETPLSGS